jgi:hypothetical protein
MVAGPSDISAAIHTYYYGEDESEYTTPMIHTSEPPPPAPSAPPPRPSAPTASSGREPASAPPEPLSDDQFVEELETEGRSRNPEIKSISVAELSESSAPPPPVTAEGALRDMAEMVENRHEDALQQQAVQRQVEKHMFGLGMSKHRGLSLTLLDGTTIDFGGANQKRAKRGESEREMLLSALRAAAAGRGANGDLPSDKWELFMAAILDILFKKNLIFPEEFLRALNRTE